MSLLFSRKLWRAPIDQVPPALTGGVVAVAYLLIAVFVAIGAWEAVRLLHEVTAASPGSVRAWVQAFQSLARAWASASWRPRRWTASLGSPRRSATFAAR